MFKKALPVVLVATINLYFLIKVLKSHNSDSIQCYQSQHETLPNIAHADPARGKSIFFLETSCSSSFEGKIVITSRQACAVESAARLNPNFEIYLLYTSPGIIKKEGTESDHFLEVLQSYRNVKMHHLDYANYTKNTPVEDLIVKIEDSSHAILHTSDILRYLTLWKYGGIYLDLDVVVIKSLQNLPLNYAGAVSDKSISAGVLSFEPTGIGHNLANQCLTDLRYNFDASENNGQRVITKLAKRICATEHVGDMLDKECIGNFRVHPSEAFYPRLWSNWEKYFTNNPQELVEQLTKNSYLVHMRNEFSRKPKLAVNADDSYIRFAEKYCPKVYKQCTDFF